MDSITIDGMEEMEFRRSIEAMLRHGQVDDAADRLRTLLADFAGEGRILPERFLSVSADDIRLEGWDRLGEKLGEYDRPEVPMSAISIDILDPQGVGARPDAGGLLKPVMETSYFSDSAYPFSEAGREDLLDGYSTFGCEWQGNCENVDTIISVEGIDDLYGATVGLENKVASSAKVELSDVQAGSVGSCYLAVLIHQAIRNTALEKGLPRPISVLAGSSDAYPFFDAPAMTAEEYRMANGLEASPGPDMSQADEDEFAQAEHHGAGGMASLESLMGLSARKKEKKPVLTIAPDEADTSESLESLESPIEASAEPEGWQYSAPAPDESEDLSPADPWPSGTIPAPVAFPVEPPSSPLDFGAGLRAESLDFASGAGATPIDFGSLRLPPSAQFESPGPAAPIEPPPVTIPPDEAVLELGGFEPFDPEEFEPPAPLERLPSETVQRERESRFDEPSGGWHDQQDQAEANLSHPQDWVEACPEAGFASPPDFGTNQAPDDPLDLEGFTTDDEPHGEVANGARQPPANDATGDKPALPPTGPARPEVARIEEPKPARHAIRVIAASVTNDRNKRNRRRASSEPSLVLGLVGGIWRACKWLWTRFARR